MRMVYSESLFLFLSVLAFVAIQRHWPAVYVAFLAGLATATRSVGVALSAAVLWQIWKTSASWKTALARLSYMAPMAVWGIVAFAVFQWWAFGEPFAFVKTQQHWRFGPSVPLGEQILSFLSWEPVWSAYLPLLPGQWDGYEKGVPLALSYHFANPTLFLLVCAMVCVGAWRKWLSGTEVIFAVGLLAIPYLALGLGCCMACQGRYVSVVFPAYLVMGRLLARTPLTLSVGVLAISALYLTIFTAMFAADYYVI